MRFVQEGAAAVARWNIDEGPLEITVEHIFQNKIKTYFGLKMIYMRYGTRDVECGDKFHQLINLSL